MKFKIHNKTGHSISIKVIQHQRAIKTYQAPDSTPVPIEESLDWNSTHFLIEQSTEIHANVFWELIGFEPVRLRYNTPASNGNQNVSFSSEHLRNELIIQNLTGGGHILVGEIGIIGEGDDA